MYDNIWENTLKLLEFDPRIDSVIFTSIYSKLKQVSCNDNLLILSCRDEYTNTLVKSKGLDRYIKEALYAYTNRDMIVQFIVEGDKDAELVTAVANSKVIDRKRESSALSNTLTSEYTFENFIVGDCNKFAHASAVSVANNPGRSQFNPLFLWGNSGLGKTHLMLAVGYSISQNFPEKRVLYTTCDDFVTAFVSCMKGSDYDAFRNKYRNIDVLMIDDIQALIGKEGTQTEFFNTFQHLMNAGKQIIITCDKAPKNLTEFDARLTSRFQNGMTMDIQPPDFETRKAIFLSKLEKGNIHVSEEIINYVCENITQNVRELNGAYNTISSLYAIYNGVLDIETVQKTLSSIISPNKKKNLTPEIIIDAVSKYYDITTDKLMSKLRSRDVHNARSVAMYLCRELLEIQYKKIGSYFGGREHSTVMNACTTVEENNELLIDVEAIKKRIME